MSTTKDKIILPGDPPFFQNPNAEKLIVFIHGLTGDATDTWTSSGDSPFFWPEQLAKDSGFQNTDVLSFGYTSDKGAPLNIPQLAQHLETTLAELNRFVQYESISFVAHSLGGLITRHFILDHFREMKIGTVVLLSTPNFGHRMSKVGKLFSANAHLEQLDPAQGKYIDVMNDKWRHEFRKKLDGEPFRMAAGYELFPLYKLFVKVGIIVEKYAAVNFASHTQAFENDHEQIAKVASKNDPKYIWVRQQLLEMPRDERNRDYTEAEEKRFEEIIDELQKELEGTDLEEALQLISAGKLDEALALLSENEEKEDEAIFKTAKTRFAKAQVYELKRDYQNALKYFEKAVQLTPKNPLYLNEAGFMAKRLGQYGKAIEYYGKAVENWEKNLGDAHPHVATGWNNLGEAWRAVGKYDKAIDYFKKGLASDLKTFGPEHPKVATYWNNLGLVWEAKRKYGAAIEYFEKAQDINLKVLGQVHPHVAAGWNNLGGAWNAMGDYNKAIENYEKGLAIDLKHFGPEHPQVAIYWNNLGVAWQDMGDYNTALEYYKKALASDLKTFGPNHPSVAYDWNNLGMVWSDNGEYDKASENLEKAKKIFQNFGLDHNATVVEGNLKAVRRKKGG